MSMGLRVDIQGLAGMPPRLGSVYESLSRIKNNLEVLERQLMTSWEDDAAGEFDVQFEKGIDSIWELMTVIDKTENSIQTIAERYERNERIIGDL